MAVETEETRSLLATIEYNADTIMRLVNLLDSLHIKLFGGSPLTREDKSINGGAAELIVTANAELDLAIRIAESIHEKL